MVLIENEALWKKIIEARYVDYEDLMLSNECRKASVPYSTLWKNLTRIGDVSANSGFDFAGNMFYKIVDGKQNRLWLRKWCRDFTLAELFPELFLITNKKMPLSMTWVDGWTKVGAGKIVGFSVRLKKLPEVDSEIQWVCWLLSLMSKMSRIMCVREFKITSSR